MKTLIFTPFILASLAFGGCQSTGGLQPGVATGVTVGTSLAVNLYPAAAPFVEMAAGAVRSISAKGVPTPAALASYLAIYGKAAENLVAKVSPKGEADVEKFITAINAKYAADYPKIVAGDMSVEQFAQAVEAGA